ncbi:MAG: type II toxin-antitoxin system PemK/MazF family toxin [Candidatus Berkelbacteria bacterium]|nr:type II toxin-antitoxin system PemK/MazF family toxin [Candidatus Berkelbacteria bacterium]MCR4307225.1 type II toxin-antitoxin system PemK/MazF family toxin [Candidatus Berkelbacteria bacterium]
MGELAVGSVVTTFFPFSNFKNGKLRPSVVLAKVDFGDLILCQITSKSYSGDSSVELTDSDFVSGGLPLTSYIRPDKLFTIEAKAAQQIIGRLQPAKINKVLLQVQQIFTVK